VLQVSLADLIAGSLESPDLGHLLLRCVVLEGQWAEADMFSPLFAGDLSHQTVFLLTDLLPRLDEAGRAALMSLAFVPGSWSSLPVFHVFMGLNGALGGPLSHEKASDLLQSTAWREAMRRASDEVRSHTLDAVAPLILRTLSESFIADSEAHSRRATLYHRFLLSLPEPADVRT